MQIILASTSQYRKQLLQNIGISAQCIGSQVDEEAIVGKNPVETSQLRARAKAKNVAKMLSEKTVDFETSVVIIGADQVVYIDQDLYGKPRDPKEWTKRLHKFSGREHQLTTSVSLWGYGTSFSRKPQELRLFSEHTRIHFRDLQHSEIDKYVQLGEAKNCAGGYMIEGYGASLIKRIDGDYQNVIGLPIFSLLRELRDLGFYIL